MPGLARHRIFAFTIGSRGYIGCGWNGTNMYQDVWEYDPGNNSWSQKADYPPGPRLCPFSFAIGMKGYVGAGLDQFLVSMVDVYEFDPIQNTWTQKNDFGGSARFGCASAVLNGKGYVAMGDEWDPNYFRQNDLWVYDPNFDSWNYVSQMPADGRRDPIGFTLGGKLFFGTGADNLGNQHNDLWQYDPANGIWTSKANAGNMLRAQATGFALNGKGYIGLGQDQLGNDRNDMLEYNYSTNSWRGVTSFSGASRENCFSFIIGNVAYLTCGTNGINYNDLWEFNPALETGTKNLEENTFSVSVFPNPAVSSCSISLIGSSAVKGSFELFDVNGKLERKILVDKDLFTLERGDLSSGTYFYKLNSIDERSVSGKIIFID